MIKIKTYVLILKLSASPNIRHIRHQISNIFGASAPTCREPHLPLNYSCTSLIRKWYTQETSACGTIQSLIGQGDQRLFKSGRESKKVELFEKGE